LLVTSGQTEQGNTHAHTYFALNVEKNVIVKCKNCVVTWYGIHGTVSFRDECTRSVTTVRITEPKIRTCLSHRFIREAKLFTQMNVGI